MIEQVELRVDEATKQVVDKVVEDLERLLEDMREDLELPLSQMRDVVTRMGTHQEATQQTIAKLKQKSSAVTSSVEALRLSNEANGKTASAKM